MILLNRTSRLDLADVPHHTRTPSSEYTQFTESIFHGTSSSGSSTAIDPSDTSGTDFDILDPWGSEAWSSEAGGSEAGDMAAGGLEAGGSEAGDPEPRVSGAGNVQIYGCHSGRGA